MAQTTFAKLVGRGIAKRWKDRSKNASHVDVKLAKDTRTRTLLAKQSREEHSAARVKLVFTLSVNALSR